MSDFDVYWRAGSRVIATEPLYRVEDGHFQHKYFPVFGVLMIPLALLPLKAAKVVWFYGSVAVIAGLVSLSVKLLPHKKAPPLTLALVTTVAMAKFFAHELNLGQCNALMALAVLAGLDLLESGRPILSGAAFALSAAIKPYALVFLPYLLLKKQVTAFGAFLGLVVAALLIPAAIYGAGGNLELLKGWIGTLSESTPANLLNEDNVSIWAMYAKWLGVGPLAVKLALGTIGVLSAATLVLIWRGSAIRESEYLEIAVVLAVLPLVSPQGWDYVLLMATPAIMLFVNAFRDLPVPVRFVSGSAVAIMAFSIFDLMGRQ